MSVQIRYIVDDVEQSIVFYTTHLAFQLVQQFGPAMAILKRGELQLWLAGPQASASKAMPDGAKPQPGGWSRFVLQIDDLVEFVKESKNNGVIFKNDIVSGPGGQQILCVDPSGNIVELFQPA